MTTYSNTFAGTLVTPVENGGGEVVTNTDTGNLSINISINALGDVVGSGTLTDTSVYTVPEPPPYGNYVSTNSGSDTETVGGALGTVPPGVQVGAIFSLAGLEASFGGDFNSAQTQITGMIDFSDGDDVPITLYGQPALPPIISFASGSLQVNANAGTATYTLTRGPVPLGDLGSSVQVSIVGGVAVAGRDYTAINNMLIVFAPGQTSATFTVPIFPDSADAAAGINPDFEVVLSNPINASIGFGSTDTTILEPTHPATAADTPDLGAGYFNHSADADIAFQAANGTPTLWIMNGTSASAVTESNPGTSWKLLPSADFNGDGNSDFLFQNVNGTPAIWLMNGTNVVSTAILTNPGAVWQIKATGDFSSNGKSDILFQNINGTPAIWFMNGTTETNAVALANPGTSWQIKGSGDFFRTGFNNDILWQNVNGTPAIWEMNGSSVIATFTLPNPTASFRIIGVGDFANDGHDDSILFQNNNGQPAIWVMNGSTVVTAFGLPNPGPSWQISGIGDFNGDGNSDIFFTNTGNGQASVWLMNGSTVVSAQMVSPSGSAQLSSASASYVPYTATEASGASVAASSTDLSSSLIATTHAPMLGVSHHA